MDIFWNCTMHYYRLNWRWRPGGRGILGISCDGDDQRIFLGLKFSISGFFGVRKFDKYFFGGNRSFRPKSVSPQVVSPQVKVVSPQVRVVSPQLKVVSPQLQSCFV